MSEAVRGPMAIMEEIAELVEANGDLQAYVPAMFPGLQLRVYIGVDDHAKPEDSDLPFLAMRPGSFAPSDDRSYRNVTIAFALCIQKAGITTTPRRSTLAGLAVLEELYFLVESAIEAYSQEKYNLQAAPGEILTEISLPYFRLTWSLTFQENY